MDDIKDNIEKYTSAFEDFDKAAEEMAEKVSARLGKTITKKDIMEAVTTVSDQAKTDGTTIAGLLFSAYADAVNAAAKDDKGAYYA